MTIISLCAYRRTRQILESVQYDDVRVEFARRVEQRAHELEVADALRQFNEAVATMSGE